MLYVFDWDGTILDSTDKIVRCMQGAIAECGLPVREPEALKQIIGLGLTEACLLLFPGLEPKAVQALRDGYSRIFVEADQQPCAFYPGVMSTLEALKGRGHTLAVATGKSRRGLDRVLDNLQLRDFFDSSRCADETASKPDPMMLHQLLLELKFNAAESLMIGDTEFDLRMAQAAGVASVAMTYGAHPLERLLPCDPVACLDDFSSLLSVEW